MSAAISTLAPHWDSRDTQLLAGLLGVLVLMSVVAIALQRSARSPQGQALAADFSARTRGWWLVVVVFAPSILAGGFVTLTVFALTALAAWHEFTTIAGQARLRACDALWTTPIVAAHFLAVAGLGPGPLWLVDAIAIGLIGLVTALSPNKEDSWIARVGWRLAGFIFCVGLLSTAVALALEFSPRWLFFTAVLVQAGDVFQYLFGKTLGRHPLVPRLSPKKTWEGLIGGVLATGALGAALAPVVLSRPPAQGLALGLGLALAGVAGGFAMSAAKRRRGVKDFGRVLPGHGGLLDRLDSVVAASAVAYFWLCL